MSNHESNWLHTLFGVAKPIIAMCHLRGLPGDPRWEASAGMAGVLANARANLAALQAGGVDGVMFSNEWSTPYMLRTEPIVGMSMARVIGALRDEIRVPFGVDVLWDARATVELAVAVEAAFVREVFTGAYASDFGLWTTGSGEVIRLRNRLGGASIRLLYNIVPEAAIGLGGRTLADVARSTEFNDQPDALCVSGVTAGAETSVEQLRTVRASVHTPVFVNTGVRAENIETMLTIADGAVVGTTFKRDGYIWNDVDEVRVRTFMDKVRLVRAQTQRPSH